MAYRSPFVSFRSLSIVLIFFLFFISVEAVFDEPCTPGNYIIQNAKDIDNCETIHGDLYLDEQFKDDAISWQITKVEGCVSIENTNLRNLSFLESVKTDCNRTNRIAYNRYFCLNSDKQDKLHWVLTCNDGKSYEACTTIVNAVTCGPSECDQAYFTQSLNRSQFAPKCEIVKGGLHVDISSKTEDHWILALSKLKEIHGGLTVENHAATDLSLFFPELRFINLTSSQTEAEKKLDKRNIGTINIKTDDKVNLQYFDLPRLERIYGGSGKTTKFMFTIPSKSEFRFSKTQRKIILKAMGPGGEVEVIGQKEQNTTMKQENVQVKKAEDVDKADEARKWTTFMFINCYLVFGFSIAMYINCCDYGGEWEEERQEWEEEQQRRKETARLKEAAKRMEAEELKGQKRAKKDEKEGKKGVETKVEAKGETKKGK